MKYVIRRALVGVIAIPVVAGAYVFLNLSLIALGADPQYTVEDTYYNGLEIGIVSAFFFAFATQFSRFLDRITNV